MNNEFKKIKNNSETRYVLETATGGSSSAGVIATAPKRTGKVQARGSILAQESDKKKESKPRNFVAKNAKMGGAGAHKDKKKEQKQGTAKHKKPYAESIDGLKDKLDTLKEAFGRRSAYQRDYDSSVSGMGRPHDHRGLEQELGHERNNYAVAIDGRTWKVFADQRQAQNIARSLQAKGKNASVHETGADPTESVEEGETPYSRTPPGHFDPMMDKFKSGIGQATAGKPAVEKPARGVDAKGRTQRQWMDLVKAKFPDAKVMQSKMIDGPVQAILPDGRKLSWNKVEQGVAEGGYYDKWKAGQDARDEKRSDMFNIVQQRGTDRANMMSRHSHDTREKAHQRQQDYLDKLHTDRMSKPAIGSGTSSGGVYGDDERAHQAQQRMNRDEYDTQRRKDDDADTRKTFDMMRDRLNRMQYKNQQGVDPEQIAKLNAIKYEPSKTEEGADSNTLTPNWAKYVLDQLYNSNGDVTMTDLFDEGIPGLHDMFMATAQEHGLDPEEDFQDVEHEVIVKLEDFIKGGHDEVKDSYMESLAASLTSVLQEKAPPGDKYERMVKHIKKGYAKDGKLSDKEKSIAYATAWKSKNKSKK